MRLALLLLVGCNQAFGLQSTGTTQPIDARFFDAPALPPCPLVPTFVAPNGYSNLAAFMSITAPVLHPSRAGTQVIYTSAGPDIRLTDENDANDKPITELTVQNHTNDSPSFGPDGATIWFSRLTQDVIPQYVNTHRATRMANGVWSSDLVDFHASHIAFEPGSPGHYRGEFRMVVGITGANTRQLVEYASDNEGLTFHELATTASISIGVTHDIDPYLTPDGCTLIYATDDGGSDFRPVIIARDAEGNFTGSPQQLVAPIHNDTLRYPAVSADQTTLWFTDNGSLNGPTP